jgi:hypothetical protein
VGDITPIIVAVVTTIGVVLAAALGANRLGARRAPGVAANAARWRDQAELEKARADLLVEERDRERTGRLEAEQKLGDTRHDLDDCVRQRDKAFSDIRVLERRRAPRPASRP